MHDGSLATMDDVLDHYSNGIVNHKNLSEELKNGNSAKKMDFSLQDKSDLIAFFETLNEPELMVDKKFSDPFK